MNKTEYCHNCEVKTIHIYETPNKRYCNRCDVYNERDNRGYWIAINLDYEERKIQERK